MGRELHGIRRAQSVCTPASQRERDKKKAVITGCVKGKKERVAFTPVAPSLELIMIIMAAIDVL